MVPEKSTRMKTVPYAMETSRVLVLIALGEDMKYGLTNPRIFEPEQKEGGVLWVRQ